MKMCNHAYIQKIASDKAVCLGCGNWVDLKASRLNTEPLVMPPVLYGIGKHNWKDWSPWPNIPLSIARKYGWYGSVIGVDDYLVMPIYADAVVVSYSARRITDNGSKKYRLPPGRTKVMWRSCEPTSSELRPPVLVAEGIADAAYLSLIANSVAVLGSYGEFDYPVITVMDGDTKGIEAAFRIVEEQKRKGHVESQAVILPGSDPTDYSITDLRRIIREQTGVKL